MSEAARPLRVAVIGAGPAGIYAADLLTKSEEVRSGAVEVSIDIFDRYPAPFGLIRYGVAPDHPRIKGIITALHKVLDRGDIRFFGNVEYGKDLNLADLREHYDAIIFATGAIYDAPLPIKGIDLDGSYGAAIRAGNAGRRNEKNPPRLHWWVLLCSRNAGDGFCARTYIPKS